MHLALRPYVTTGVALVGAAVMAVAPITATPPDITIVNPVAQGQRAVELAASTEIQDAVNDAIFDFVASPTVAGAELLGRLLTPLIGEEQAILLPLAALGISGPLISGGGAGAEALQTLLDSDGLESLLLNLIGGGGTIIDGLVNGGYGPDLAPLVEDIMGRVIPGLEEFPGDPAILAGGLINGLVIEGFNIGARCPVTCDGPEITLPGTVPTLQGLVGQLFGLFGGFSH